MLLIGPLPIPNFNLISVAKYSKSILNSPFFSLIKSSVLILGRPSASKSIISNASEIVLCNKFSLASKRPSFVFVIEDNFL